MLQWLVIASLASTVANSLECGKAPLDNPLESRVVGGHAPVEGNFPFIANVRNLATNGSCSGSIVGRRHVLTAAHCVDNSSNPLPENIDPNRFQVRVGSVWRYQRTWLAVKHVFTGPNWSRANGLGRKVDDIAILELKAPIEFNDYAQPICLPKSFRERPGDPGYFVGWGWQNNVPEPHNKTTDYDWPAVANENMLTFRKWSHCSPTNKFSPYLHREDLICVGQYMRLVVQGDSGGPLMINRKGTWFQVGTLSGGSEGHGRGQKKFSRVTSYCKWFQNVTNGEVNCAKL